MAKREERVTIYGALTVLSLLAGLFIGFTVAAWTFVQVVAVFELVCLLGRPGRDTKGVGELV